MYSYLRTFRFNLNRRQIGGRRKKKNRNKARHSIHSKKQFSISYIEKKIFNVPEGKRIKTETTHRYHNHKSMDCSYFYTINI
jgi:hypothetical protein